MLQVKFKNSQIKTFQSSCPEKEQSLVDVINWFVFINHNKLFTFSNIKDTFSFIISDLISIRY